MNDSQAFVVDAIFISESSPAQHLSVHIAQSSPCISHLLTAIETITKHPLAMTTALYDAQVLSPSSSLLSYPFTRQQTSQEKSDELKHCVVIIARNPPSQLEPLPSQPHGPVITLHSAMPLNFTPPEFLRVANSGLVTSGGNSVFSISELSNRDESFGISNSFREMIQSPYIPHYRGAVPGRVPSGISEENRSFLLQHPWQSGIDSLVEMGFTQQEANRALLISRNNVPIAADWLLQNQGGEESNRQSGLNARNISQMIVSLGIPDIDVSPFPPVERIPEAPMIPPPVDPSSSNSLLNSDVRYCLANGICTFSATRANLSPQPYFECFTCDLTTRSNKGICLSCQRTCHVGHNISLPRFSMNFYCDCGASSNCQTLRHLTLPQSSEQSEQKHPGVMDAISSTIPESPEAKEIDENKVSFFEISEEPLQAVAYSADVRIPAANELFLENPSFDSTRFTAEDMGHFNLLLNSLSSNDALNTERYLSSLDKAMALQYLRGSYVLNVLISVIKTIPGYKHFENLMRRHSVSPHPNVESVYNIAIPVAQSYRKSGSDLTLEKCLLFFINLTSHPYPNELAILNWSLFCDTFLQSVIHHRSTVILQAGVRSLTNYLLLFSANISEHRSKIQIIRYYIINIIHRCIQSSEQMPPALSEDILFAVSYILRNTPVEIDDEFHAAVSDLRNRIANSNSEGSSNSNN